MKTLTFKSLVDNAMTKVLTQCFDTSEEKEDKIYRRQKLLLQT